MKTRNRIAVTALLCASVAMPAIAQNWGAQGPGPGADRDRWGRIGTVEFNTQRERDTRYGGFGGPIDGLQLFARDADVRCRDIRVTFGNGRSRSVFEGNLPQGRAVNINLPDDRSVREVEFFCRATSRGSRVDISVNLGRYQAEWRRNPNWNRWASAFPWADRDRDMRWVTLGTERFEGRRDRETTITAWRGQQIESLALQPMNADARCRRIQVTFRNGRSRELQFSRGNYLTQGQFYRIDLPGGDRNVERIDMTCQAVRDRAVTMQIFASR